MNSSSKLPNNNDTFLGFDYGIKKIGTALAMRATGIVTPLETIYACQQKTNWKRISALIEEWRPSGLVVGVSYHQDGTENMVTQPMLRFSRQLEGRYRIPVYLIDETLSTREAKRMLLDDMGVKPGALKKIHDQLAAKLILETWMTTMPPISDSQ